MKDAPYIVLFLAIGLGVSYLVSAPLRKPASERPQVGTPLEQPRTAAPSDISSRKDVYVEGILSLGKGVSADGKTLFVIVRAEESAGGPPLAAKRFPSPAFPLPYKVLAADGMVSQDFYHGPIRVIARLDADGQAGPKQEGDVEVRQSVDLNTRSANLTIS